MMDDGGGRAWHHRGPPKCSSSKSLGNVDVEFSSTGCFKRDNQEEMRRYKRHWREMGGLAGLRQQSCRIKAEIVTFICLDWVCQASVYAAKAIMAPS